MLHYGVDHGLGLADSVSMVLRMGLNKAAEVDKNSDTEEAEYTEGEEG